MVTAFAATRLKLLLRRPRPGKWPSSTKKRGQAIPQYLLQEIDPVAGRFSAGTACRPL